MKIKAKIARKDTREHLAQFHLTCELLKVIHHYSRTTVYIKETGWSSRPEIYHLREPCLTDDTYPLFYFISMRKTSQEFNSDTIIKNIGYLYGKPELSDIPYCETIMTILRDWPRPTAGRSL